MIKRRRARERAELVRALDALTAELKRQTSVAKSVQMTGNAQMTKTLADLVNGQIVGRGRGFKPGPGADATY